jgi:hypothetical protein
MPRLVTSALKSVEVTSSFYGVTEDSHARDAFIWLSMESPTILFERTSLNGTQI